MPLRQLAARQFSHWMFAEPKNILLEQAVHPLSQVLTLVGPALHVEAMAGKPTEIAPGVSFYLLMQCDAAERAYTSSSPLCRRSELSDLAD